MNDFDQLNRSYGPGNQDMKQEMLKKDLELEKIREENRVMRQEIQSQENQISSNLRSGIDTFRQGGGKEDMESSHFLSSLLIRVYHNIKDLYNNVGMNKRSRDIGKLIECLTSIINLTIEKNEKIPPKTQKTML